MDPRVHHLHGGGAAVRGILTVERDWDPRQLAFIREYDMLPKGSVVVCAVSGGADSMCLLHWLSRQEGLTLHAAHFNHRLRGEESDRDEAFVRDWCEGRHIPFHLGAGDVAAEAKKRKQGIEETARQLRYDFLFRLAEECGADRIATAHNADDNLETMLLHLVRGTGLQGLTGISPRQGKLVRPLLTVTRREIEAYLEENQVPHVEDSTNADGTYSRNKMRHSLLPLLEEWNPSLRENSVDTLRHLRADNDYLNALAADLSQKAVVKEGEVSLPAAFVAGAPGPVAVRVVRQLLSMAPGGSTDCTGAHLEALLALCRSEDPSGQVHLPHGLTARREYGLLVLSTRQDGGPSWAAFEPREGENPVPGTAWTVSVAGPPWPGLVVRHRQTGDEITLPNGHRRSLKRLFIDRKVPRPERDRLPVVSDSGGVIAVGGIGTNCNHPRKGQIMIKVREDTSDAKE